MQSANPRRNRSKATFTAFTLRTDSTDAMSKWLADNGLLSSEQNDRWLEHFAGRDFYFVAMRLDLPPDPKAPVKAETVRISFDTPVAYYPYKEPGVPKGAAARQRLMELWYVSQEMVVPVALREDDEGRRFVRPLKEGKAYPNVRAKLEGALES